MRIGVVGYSAGKFNIPEAIDMLRQGFDKLITNGHKFGEPIWVVSGYTDLGIPAIAYRLASRLNWKTKGIACSKSSENPCFPCDEVEIHGDDWGDESPSFLNDIDVLLRVGGGEQCMEEVEEFKKRKGFEPWKLVEFDLERKDD